MKIFIINTLLFSGLYYTLYVLLFRNRSFLQLNRAILLLIPALSIGIPLIAPFYDDPLLENSDFHISLLPVTISSAPSTEENIFTLGSFNWQWIYYTGAGLSLLFFVIGLIKVYRIISKSEAVNWNDLKFRLSKKTASPFAFFQNIIIPSALLDHPDLKTVLSHEEVHRQQMHSTDNIYYGLLGIIFWFNPFIHLLAREVRQTHECLADQKALQETSREVYARMLLSSTFGKEWSVPMTIGTVNPFFNSSLLKTRITMLYKKESPKWLKATYWLMLPLAIAMTLHACNKGTDKSDQASAVTKAYEFTEVEQPPLFAGCSTSANSDDQKACFNQGIIKHIQENLEYPEQAKELGISGKVYIEFVVNEKGNVSDVKMLRGITLEENANAELKQAAKSLEDRAIHLVSDIPGLTPARLKGKKVAMKFVLPINFRVK